MRLAGYDDGNGDDEEEEDDDDNDDVDIATRARQPL